MPITETPPAPSKQQVPPDDSAMLVGFNPMLLSELQDELASSRLREAFWISVAAHLFIVIGLVTLPAYLVPRRAVVVQTAEDMLKGKDLTYLELPPDAQKPPEKPPQSNIISDKNRIATSRNPTIDRKTLDELRDNRRPGPPGMPGPAMRPSAPAAAQPQQQVAQAPPTPQNQANSQPGEGGAPPMPQAQTQARLEPPPISPHPSFGGGALSPGSAIEQAARATAGSRGGGFSGGAAGDYGLGRGNGQGKVGSQLDILSDTMGVDFGPYLQRVLHDVRQNWYAVIPEAAMPPILKKGKVSIEFAITKDGRVAGLRLVGSSGDPSLDRAAWAGITTSDPFPALPREFGGPYLALRFHFYYNPGPNDIR